MLRATVDTLVEVLGAQMVLGDPESPVIDVAIDSRSVEPGCAFVALPGDRVDGHDYLIDALEAGARLLVVTREIAELSDVIVIAGRRGASICRVPDSLVAVQQLAQWHRGRLRCLVVGVTGSTGKTTTKDLLTSVLSTNSCVAATQGNRNNELGVPLTILGAGSDVDVLVVEMGMRGKGQISQLCTIARPDFGLVTNVGQSHIEVLGSQEAIIEAKGELAVAIPEDGAVFLNGDDANSAPLGARSIANVITYGLGSTCDVTAHDIIIDEQGRASFRLHSDQGSVDVTLRVPGRHNVYNALAAAAVGLRLAVPLDDIARGLQGAGSSAMRMESFVTADGVTVINDAYNANPTSMAAAVETLASMAVTGKRVAVFGDMAELGSLAELAHFQIGESVGRADIQVLVTVGERARRIAEGARAEGMAGDMVFACKTVDEALELLDDMVEREDVVLVKASRVMGLERIVEGIVAPRAAR